MRRVTIGTANGLFKKGKETNTTKRRSREELEICWRNLSGCRHRGAR